MSLLRRRAVWLAALVLLAQVAAFAATAVTIAVCCRRAPSKDTRMDCCKGSGQSCPLMKRQKPEQADCSMTSCPGNNERVASLLFDGRGVLVASESVTLQQEATRLETRGDRPRSRCTPVETPHPRT